MDGENAIADKSPPRRFQIDQETDATTPAKDGPGQAEAEQGTRQGAKGEENSGRKST